MVSCFWTLEENRCEASALNFVTHLIAELSIRTVLTGLFVCVERWLKNTKLNKCVHCCQFLCDIIQNEKCIIVACPWTFHIFFAVDNDSFVGVVRVFCGVQMAQTTFGAFNRKTSGTNCNAIHWKYSRSCYRIWWYALPAQINDFDWMISQVLPHLVPRDCMIVAPQKRNAKKSICHIQVDF